ncbi:MAG: FAD:protein FMN transferase [Lachnospiraceae bacterium]|nr:FAD:protein FMN transferase [Lachnospiraceae bacterium]
MTQKKSIWPAAFGAFLLAGILAVGSGYNRNHSTVNPMERTDFLLNTFVNIKIYDSKDPAVLDEAFALCRDYEERLSRTLENSEIYKLNHRNPDEREFELSDETAKLMEKALHYCKISDGAFDITIEPASSLWDFTSEDPQLPDPDQLTEAIQKTGYENLVLEGNTLTFLSPDTRIDLGAIAKGYIADQIKEYLLSQNVSSAIINLGGNVLCIGSRPNSEPFRIGLQKPFAEREETFSTANVNDLSVVTSGVYERHFIINGTNYHHILNPKTGYPYDNGLISVSILSEHSADGDGLSTTCFSLGLEQGMKLINSLDGVYGCFIDEDYNVYYSDGMEEFLSDS